MTAPTLRDSPQGEARNGLGARLRRLLTGRSSLATQAVKVAAGADKTIAPEAARIMRAVADHNQHVWPRMDSAMQQADEYQRSSWVYVAVTRIAEAAALVPLEVTATRNGERIVQRDHPIERLLRAPNPYQSQFELFEATFGTLELTGNAYWFLAGPAGGAPESIWLLRSDRVRVVTDKTQFIGGYVYTVDGVDIPLSADEVIHFKRWHPANDLYGMSALEAAAMASQTDRAMQRWNMGFFSRDKAIPAGIVNIKNMVSDADLERIIREFKESFSGSERRTAFIRGGDISWEDIGLSQRDSDFLAARQMNKQEIFQVYGIPAGLYDPNATEANATIARQTFLEDTIWPKLVRLTQKLTQELAPFFGDDLVIVPEDIRDTSADLAEVQAASRYLTINEIRQRYFHVDPLPDGDRIAGEVIKATSGPEKSGPPQGDGPYKESRVAVFGEANKTKLAAIKSAVQEKGEDERMNEYFPTAVKALNEEGTRIGGYLIVYGDRYHRDLHREYFTDRSDLGLGWYPIRPMLYHHALDPEVGSSMIGIIDTLVPDEIGVWCEGNLELRSQHGLAVKAMIERGEVGWSSGSLPHLVVKSADGEILRWPIVEASITKVPAQRHNSEVRVIESAYKALGLETSRFESANQGEWMTDNVQNDLVQTVSALTESVKSLRAEINRPANAVPAAPTKRLPMSDSGANQTRVEVLRATKYSDLSAQDMAFLHEIMSSNVRGWTPQEGFYRELADKAFRAVNGGQLSYDAVKGLVERGYTKANELDSSAQAGYGSEWVADSWRSELWTKVRQDNVIAPLFPKVIHIILRILPADVGNFPVYYYKALLAH